MRASLLAAWLAAAGLLFAPSAQAGMDAQLFKGGLDFPAAFTFAPDGRIFSGERFTGAIHILSADGSTDDLFFTIPDVVSNGEQGLLGLALHPGYPVTPYVYAYATRDVGGGNLENQIVRMTDNAGTGQDMQVMFTSPTTAGTYHDGGRILFGPDGMLYAIVGEGHNSRNSQRLRNTAGKILRMTPSGTAPGDNPFPGKLIWAYGIRNSFGFTFDPQNGRLWETENGPECNDELNRIVKGRNFGWGRHETCSHPPKSPVNTNHDGPNPIMPKLWYTPTIAPTGAVFCDGCSLGTGTERRLFFGAYNTGQIRKVVLNAKRSGVTSQSVVFTSSSGILSMERSPDGHLFFSDEGGIYELISV